jgi:hypothetical protein
MYVERDELELELLVARIDRHELDPRPDRPADRAWDLARQQRFIDSILRGWCVPPVHVAGAGPTEPEVVLDGGQRLHAVSRFFHDELTCAGVTTPLRGGLERFEGLRFSDLPTEVRRSVRRFRITVVTLSDFGAAELAELFDRLHEPDRSITRVPAPRAGGAERDRGHRISAPSEPIYDQVSAWFADLSDFWLLSEVGDGPSWASPADAGHNAARVAADPPDAGLTGAGLPQREPRAQLIPGAIASPAHAAVATAPRPSPDDLSERLASYQHGVVEARSDRTGPDAPDAPNALETGPIPHPIFDVDDPR